MQAAYVQEDDARRGRGHVYIRRDTRDQAPLQELRILGPPRGDDSNARAFEQFRWIGWIQLGRRILGRFELRRWLVWRRRRRAQLLIRHAPAPPAKCAASEMRRHQFGLRARITMVVAPKDAATFRVSALGLAEK